MANTTNFNWETPDDTDLVKDGAAAIRTLGNSIDTSFVDLKGGTTGQILSKASNTDLDYTWITNDVGDITAVTAGTGISGGGTSGAVTITNSMATEITAAGDIIIGTGSATFDNLPIGTTGQVLTADTTVSPYKVKWASPAGATFVGVQVYNTTAQSVANETDFYPTFNTESWDTDSFHSTTTNTGRLTVPSGQAGKYLVYATCGFAANSTGWRRFGFAKNRTTEQPIFFFPGMASQQVSYPIVAVLDLAVADYVEILVQQNSGGSLNYSGGLAYSAFGMYKIG